MPKVQVQYGFDNVEISVDAECDVLLPAVAEGGNTYEVLKSAMDNPFWACHFMEFLEEAESVLVVVNDNTRATPTAAMLDTMMAVLDKAPKVRYMVAVGSHGQPDRDGLKAIFGHHYKRIKKQIIIHDCRDKDQLVELGATSRGTPVLVNRHAVEADRVVVIGNAEPHYFAGVSGARKAIVPGIAGFETIAANHSMASDPGAETLKLEGNPVHEDMAEASSMLGRKVFAYLVVLDPEKEAVSAFCGSPEEALASASEEVRRIYSVPVKEKYDIVVACVPPPKDVSWYQSQHALENGKLILREGGIIIWTSACRDGVGNDAFLKRLHELAGKDLAELEAHEYRLGDHKATRILRTLDHSKIWTVLGVPEDLVIRAGLKPYRDIQTALDDAIAEMRARGTEPAVAVMPNGTWTVPDTS